MKKIITIFILFLLSLNIIGLYPIFKLVQFHSKELAENIIKQGNPANIVVFADLHNNKEVKWEENNKEFSYRGKMYDVAREETEEGNLLYYCYDDSKETGICNKIDQLVNKRLTDVNDSCGNAVLHLMIMLTQVFIPSELFFVPAQPRDNIAKNTLSFYSGGYTFCVLEIPAPPPWA